MRAIWKGHLRFSLVTIPIRIYSAVDAKETISFNQLHKEDNGRVGYDKKCKSCNKVLKSDDIVKGYEYQPGSFVIVDSDDLNSIKLESTKIIDIQNFVNISEIPPFLYDAPYFIGPDGEVAKTAYSLLVQSLRGVNKVGVAKVVIRDREDIVLIGHYEESIMMYKIRYPQEIRNTKDIPELDEFKINKDQLTLAHSLIDSMTTDFADIDIQDTYQTALKEMIDNKIAGKEVVAEKEKEEVVMEPSDLM
ncbi:MAG: Ku protein, partial [Novosphingobium sp.]|nr:Ku protein [Novosphingobium sp.]